MHHLRRCDDDALTRFHNPASGPQLTVLKAAQKINFVLYSRDFHALGRHGQSRITARNVRQCAHGATMKPPLLLAHFVTVGKRHLDTTGLDPQGMVDIRDLILELAADHKKTVFLSSHILPEVELTASRMVIINRGTAVVEGAVQDLLNAGRLKVTIETTEVTRALEIIRATPLTHHIQSHTDDKIIMMMERDEIAGIVAHLSAANIPLSAVSPVRSLEEYFIALTQEAP